MSTIWIHYQPVQCRQHVPGVSWDSALSCVVVKKEKIEDDEENSDSCEEKIRK